MSALFFDSSALVKRYVKESGTKRVSRLVRPSSHHRLYLAEITGIEVISALTKRVRVGSVTQAVANKAISRFVGEFSNYYILVEINLSLIQNAMKLAQSHPLRGYDAVQLAAALHVNSERLTVGGSALTFVSADNNLNLAAKNEGLKVDNPNNYP